MLIITHPQALERGHTDPRILYMNRLGMYIGLMAPEQLVHTDNRRNSSLFPIFQ